MTIELYKRYRPKKFRDVVGQKEAVMQLEEKLKKNSLQHSILFSGLSGCGKTTLARILRIKLECTKEDYVEINAASSRGIDTIRDIQQRMGLAPIGGRCRIWCIDECHRLTGDAQSGLLKILEDTPKHVYFILCTTDPQKLLLTIRTRCTKISLRPLSQKDLESLIGTVVLAETIPVPGTVIEKIAELADGSAREALVLLDQVINLPGEQEQLEVLQRTNTQKKSIDIARALIRGTNWREVSDLIKELEDDPETVRRVILGYATKVALNSGQPKAFAILNACRDHWYDCGIAGLVCACKDILGDR